MIFKNIYIAHTETSERFNFRLRTTNSISIHLNTVSLFMDIFAAVIVTTNTSKKRAHDIVQSPPLRRSTRDRGEARILQRWRGGGGGSHSHSHSLLSIANKIMKCLTFTNSFNVTLSCIIQFLTLKNYHDLALGNSVFGCISEYDGLEITICTRKKSSPYINDTFKRINLFYIISAEALDFEIDNEGHC